VRDLFIHKDARFHIVKQIYQSISIILVIIIHQNSLKSITTLGLIAHIQAMTLAIARIYK